MGTSQSAAALTMKLYCDLAKKYGRGGFFKIFIFFYDTPCNIAKQLITRALFT